LIFIFVGDVIIGVGLGISYDAIGPSLQSQGEILCFFFKIYAISTHLQPMIRLLASVVHKL